MIMRGLLQAVTDQLKTVSYLTITNFPPLSTVLIGILAAGFTLRLLPNTRCRSDSSECPKPRSKSLSLKFYKLHDIRKLVPH